MSMAPTRPSNCKGYSYTHIPHLAGKRIPPPRNDLTHMFVAQHMTAQQIAEAQKLAHEWKPKKEESRPVGAH